MSNRLILGTAAFGSDYGIKHDGQPSTKEIEKIAHVAWNGGIKVIHTSWQYSFDCIDIFDSFHRIYKDKNNPILFKWIDKIGKSIYSPSEINNPFVDIYQLPINILDNRFLKSFKGLKNWNHEIHARSVFLQGLLLMDSLPIWLTSTTRTVIDWFHSTCKKEKLEYYEAALGWVLGLKDIDHVIVGVNNAEQLEQLLEVKPLQWNYDFSIQDENVLDPRKWPTLHNQLKKSVESSTAIEGVNIKS